MKSFLLEFLVGHGCGAGGGELNLGPAEQKIRQCDVSITPQQKKNFTWPEFAIWKASSYSSAAGSSPQRRSCLKNR